MARPTFRRELASVAAGGAAFATLSPSFTQLFARKGLDAPEWLIALLLSEAMLGNVFGAFIGRFIGRRGRVSVSVAARIVIAAVMLLIALLPPVSDMAIPYAALLLLPALLAAAMTNIAASVWHSNYPERVRGQIVSRLLMVNMVAVMVFMKLTGLALDAAPGWAHRAIYPAAAVLTLLGAGFYSRIRVRNERRMRGESLRERPRLFAGFGVLLSNPSYGWFMLWQMLSGSAVLMTAPVLLLYLTDVLKVSYGEGIDAMTVVPFGVCVASMPMFGRLFDRMSVTRFRAIGAAIWTASRGAILAGFAAGSWLVIIAGFALQGIAQGTGNFAYNIGHTRFSRPHEGHLYMGIHMTLQGLRGLTMPAVGVWLYGVMGVKVMAVALGLQLVATLGFALMKTPPSPVDADDPAEAITAP